jgi:neurotransmitter-gated ion-channel
VPSHFCKSSSVALFCCLLIAAVLVVCGWSPAAQGDTQVNLTFTTPPNHGQPVEVRVGVYLTNLAQIDELLEQFQVKGTLFARWRDPRLAAKPGENVDRVRLFKPGEIWLPELEMINSVSPREQHDITITVDPSGTVEYAEVFAVTLSTQLRLRSFPFDSQWLTILVRPLRSPDQPVALIADSTRCGSSVQLAQWRTLGLDSSTGTATTLENAPPLPQVNFDLRVKRRYIFYVWKVFVPLVVLVMISWTAFWIRLDDHYSQMTVALTTILTVIAFAFSISSSLPRLPYLTLIDAFFLISYLFVFSAILEHVVIHNLLAAKREPTARRFRQFSRWLFPVGYLIINTIVAWRFAA